MDSILTDASEASLVRAIRGNLCGFFQYLTRTLPPGDGFENDSFIRWHTPLAQPWFNGFLCKAPPTLADSDFIRETIQYFAERQVETFTCWLDPGLAHTDWKPFLVKYRFGFSNGTPGMALDLSMLPESSAKPKGLEIRVVEDQTTMQTWAHTFTLGYGMPPDWENDIFDVWLQLGLDFPVRNYLGYLDGEAVATSTVFYSAGVAGIYDVATLPQARGRGIGSALTLVPLLDARQEGYRISILQSSEMGFGVYKRMGFRHLCQIENFYFRP